MRASVNIGDCKSPSSAPADCKSAGTGYRDGEVVAEYRQRDSIPQYKKLLMVTYAIGPFYHNSLPQWTDKDTLTIDYVFAYRLKTDCNTDVSIRTINDWQSYMPSVKQSIAIGSQNGLTVPTRH